MFCPKCGTQFPDDAAFCPKCGNKLDIGSSAQQPNTTQEDVPQEEKKKKKTLPIILGVAVLLVVIIIVVSSGGGTDYIATVKAHKPFATSQNLPYTYAEVFDEYLSNLRWSVDSQDKKTDVAVVKVEGTVKGTNRDFSAKIKVSPNPDDPNGCLISPQSVVVNGEESPSRNDAVEFLYRLFAAYGSGK